MDERIRELKVKVSLAEASESVGKKVRPLAERIQELSEEVKPLALGQSDSHHRLKSQQCH